MPERRGFALVVALALMSFLLLLLVALSTLVQIEARRGTAELRQFEARQNALLGLRIALAQLQKEAGPDRRITARADILAPTQDGDDDSPDVPTVTPNGTKQFWTGVFDPDLDRSEMRTSVRWLVSGAPRGLEVVGSGVGGGDYFPIFNFGFVPEEKIHVPLVSISASTGDVIGRFAYYVADEGMKAKINLYNDPDRGGALFAAHRFGVENVQMGGDGEGWATHKEIVQSLQESVQVQLASMHNPTSPDGSGLSLGRLSQLDSFHYAIGLGTSPDSAEESSIYRSWRELLNRASIDVTPYSFGLLTNMNEGGFKIDLTSYFDQGTPQGLIFPQDRLEFGATMEAVSAANRRHLRGPDWRLLYNFSQLGNQIVPGSGSTADAIAPRPGSAPRLSLNHTTPGFYGDEPTIAPVLISAGLRFGLDSTLTLDGNRLSISVSPLIALWNPYDVRLLAEDYIVEFDNSGGAHWSSSPILTVALIDATNPWWQAHRSLYRFIDEENPWVPGEPQRTWREHAAGSVPPEQRVFSMRINPAEFSPDFDPDLLSASGLSGSEDFRRHNLHFALEKVVLEPGEIAWFTVEGRGLDFSNPENRILSRGENNGYYEIPFSAEMGYAQAYIGSYQYRYQKDYDEDFGLVTDEDFEIGSARLGLQTERFIALMRMRDPDNIVSLVDELSTSPATRAFRDQDRWPIVQYMSCARTAQSRTSDLIPLGSLRADDYLSQVHVRLSAPFQDIFHWPMSGTEPPSDTGLKLLANFAVRSRVQTSIGFSEVGVSNYSSPLYRIDYHVDPLQEYFEPNELWEKADYGNAAIFDHGDPDAPRYGVVLFHIPRGQLYSIGQFQHLDFSMSPWDPTYAVGNSLASPWIPAADIDRRENANHTRRDRSYYLNDLLWDSFFFSTWDPSDQGGPLNPRLLSLVQPQEEAPGVPAPDVAASLMIDGPFNINSTSVEAWKAVLSSLNMLELEYRPTPQSSLSSEVVSNLFSRSGTPHGGTAEQPTGSGLFNGSDAAYWRGFRQLSQQQIDELAAQIVRQIRERGPFRSLGHFVNRVPGEPAGEYSIDHSLMGALQAAIELQSDESTVPLNSLDPAMWVYADGESGFVNRYKYLYEAPALGPRRQGAPGYLMQSDILTPLGPILTARSDTFVIRTYGDVSDAFSGDIQARAVGEAVVQRHPGFVDSADAPTEADLNSVNETFGRRFSVLSFRWLNPDEI